MPYCAYNQILQDDMQLKRQQYDAFEQFQLLAYLSIDLIPTCMRLHESKPVLAIFILDEISWTRK